MMFGEAVIIVTRRCNMKCMHCYERKKDEEISISLARKISELLRKNNAKKVTLIGGEPFLHKEIDTIVDLFGKINVSITTNGSSVPFSLSHTKKANLKFVSVSLHYFTEEKFTKFTNSTYPLSRIKENIKLLKQLYPVVINTCVLPDNELDIRRIIEFAKKEKLLGVKLSQLALVGDAYCNYTSIQEFNHNPFFEKRTDQGCYKGNCGLTERLVFDVDGSIYGCVTHLDNKDLCLGNIQTFDIYNHETQLRRIISNKPESGCLLGNRRL